jgi:hypothetical protein
MLDVTKTYDLFVSRVPGSMGGSALGVAPGTTDLVIEIARGGGTISGRVIDGSGDPVPAGVVVVAGAKGVGNHRPGAWSRTETTADGMFMLTNLGDYSFRVWAGGQKSDFSRTDLREAVERGSSDIVITVQRRYRLSGRFVDADGNPVGVDEVIFEGVEEGPDGPYRVTLSGGRTREGLFDYSRITVPRVRLSVRIGEETLEVGTFDLPATDLEIPVPKR